MFDASFYREVLPDRVLQECQGHPGEVPVVLLHLATGGTLDLCHILHLGDPWLAVQHFRDAQACDDMDTTFLPYGLVTMVTVTLRHAEDRRLGFRMDEHPVSPRQDKTRSRGMARRRVDHHTLGSAPETPKLDRTA